MAMRRTRDGKSHSLSSNDSEGKGEYRRERSQRPGKMVELDIPGKLFIRGLANDADEKIIENAFAKFGRITEIIVIRDKVTLQSRGYGFVTYENPIDAEDAVKAMEGVDLHGKTVHVEQAVRAQHLYDDGYRRGRGGRGRGGMSPRGRRGGGGRMGGSGRGPPDMPPRRGGPGGRGMRPGGRGVPRGPPPRRDSRDMRDTRDMRDFSPPPRREDRFSSSYSDRSMPPRGRDYYSPPRDSSRGLLDSRMAPSRGVRDYPPVRDYSPDRAPMRDRGMTSRDYVPVRTDDRRDTFSRSTSRDYSSRGGGDYFSSRDTTRDYVVRDYPPSRDYTSREPNGRDRDYGASAPRFSSRSDMDRDYDADMPSRGYSGPGSRGPLTVSSRGPPSFASRGPPRDDRDDFAPGARRPGPPMSRGPPPTKRSRMDGPPPFRR